jgi:hypothetical protein
MADQQIIDYGATANDGTGDPLRDAFIKVDDNFSAIWEAGPVGSNVVISNNTIEIINTNGNLVLKPNGIGTVQVRNSVLPVGNNIYNLGSANAVFRSLYLGSGGFTTSGNITADYFIGDGSLLTNITVAGGTAIVNGTSNVVVAASGNITVGVAGVAGVATFTTNGLTVPGNVAAGNISGNGAALTSVSTDRGSDTNNWNTLTQMGAYKVNRVSWSGTTGTPTDSAVFVGLLQVITAGDTTTQMFFPGTVQSGNEQIQWNRTLWSGTWTNWTKIINNGQIIDAGSF